jgi:cell division protein FtsZ
MTQQELNLDGAPGVTVFGVGGAGGNAVGHLFRDGDWGMKIICANTDVQALRAAPSANQLQLGRQLTGGLGAGARPEVGRAAAEEALPEIVEALLGTSLCFIAAGLGGGTGTGAAPVIARAARELGILTIGIATRPFAFEGARRARAAAAGVIDLQDNVDALVVVCNQNLLRLAGPDTTFREALLLSDSVVCESATDFAALIASPALKRLNVADIRSTLQSGGRTVIGYGERCGGRDRALAAARSALRNPLIEDAPQGAARMLVTIAGGADLGLFEIEEALDHLREHVHAGVDLVWGSIVDPSLEGRMRIGIAASGLPLQSAAAEPVAAPAPAANRARAVQFAAPPSLAPAVMTARAAPPEIQHPLPAVPAEMVEGSATPEIPAELECAPPVDNALIRETRAVDESIHDSDVLVLNSTYSLALDSTANRPPARGPIRSRGRSSLVDRIYFATRDLKRSWQRPPVLADEPPPRVIRVTRGLPQLAA